MGRERRVSFVLSSHARFLSGAHEGQWDGDTGLYYLGARFYDPSLGRFIQEDTVEGSADHPASQNRYVYCQNDPVSLIDPTGYSPENTGTPPRFTPMNYSNIQSSEGGMNSCYMEDYTPMVAVVQDAAGWDHRFSPISMAEAGRQAAARDAAQRRNEHQDLLIEGMFESNDGCKDGYWVTMYIDGERIDITIDKYGFITGKTYSEKGKAIFDAIKNALIELIFEGGRLISASEVRNLLVSVQSFYDQNYFIWSEITRYKEGAVTEFIHHAMIGGFIATQMQKYGKGSSGYDYDQHDMSFGFWASYYSSQTGIPIPLLPSKKGIPSPNDPLSLVDVANLLKAKGYQESRLGEDDKSKGDNGSGFGGIMQVPLNGESKKGGLFIFDEDATDGGDWASVIKGAPKLFNGGVKFFNPFNNIGIGAGYLFGKLIGATPYPYWDHITKTPKGNPSTPTLDQWTAAIIKYGDPKQGDYSKDILNLFLTGQHPYESTRVLFDPNNYFNNRRIKFKPMSMIRKEDEHERR